jgi:hypothetical protein
MCRAGGEKPFLMQQQHKNVNRIPYQSSWVRRRYLAGDQETAYLATTPSEPPALFLTFYSK